MFFYLYFKNILRVNAQSSNDDQTTINYIYSTFPSRELNINNTLASSNRIIYNNQQNILLTSWGNGGLAIFDIQSSNLEYFFPSTQLIRGMAFTQDGFIIIFMQKNCLNSYYYDRQQLKSKLVLKSQSQQIEAEVFDIILTSDENVAILLQSNGVISVYDVRQKRNDGGNFLFLAQIEAKSNLIYRGVLDVSEQFLFIANDYSGMIMFNFNKQLIPNQKNPISQDIKITLSYRAQIPSDWQIVDIALTIDQTYIYAADCWSGIQVIYTHSDDPANQWMPELKVKNYWPDLSSTIPMSLKLTLDNQKLLVASRQQGVLILDISNKSNPVLFQRISIKGHAFSVQLTNQDQQLFYANGDTIFEYEKVTPNLSQDIPNLSNDHIAKLYQIGNYQYRWRCYVSQDDSFFFGAFDKVGLFVYSLKTDPNNQAIINPYQMKQVNHINFVEQTSIDCVLFFYEVDLLFLAVSQESSKLFVYKISEVTKLNNNSVQPIFKMPFNNSNTISETLVANKNKTMIAVTVDNGFLLINCSNPQQIKIISQYLVPPRMIGICNGIIFSDDSKFIILAMRNYGFISVDISNPTQPQFGDEIQTLGGEFILSSLTKDNFAYISDGYKGFVILDLNQLPNFKFVRYQVDGWLNHITPFSLENYLLLSHMDNGYISLLSVADKKNPITLSRQFKQNQNAMSSCLTQDQKHLFITNNFGVNVIPLQSEIMMHTQVLLISGIENGNISYTPYNLQDNLQIGQSFLFQFIPIYPQNSLLLQNIQYQSPENILVDPPSWINYHLSSYSVQIDAVKEGLGQNVSLPNLNSIVLTFQTTLGPDSFVYSDIGDGVTTDSTMGSNIMQYLVNQDIISNNSYASSKFLSQRQINFAELNLGGIEKNPALQERITFTILRSIQKNPIMFYIAPSLNFNVSTGTISSLSNQVNLYLSVDKSQALFIQIPYAGVLSSFNDDGSSVKLEGSAQALNLLFQNQKIVYFSNLTSISAINISFYLQDNINYDIQTCYLLSDLALPYIPPQQQINNTKFSNDPTKILRQKLHTIMNPNEKKLQQQFNSIFPNSEVSVEESVSFEFSESTFESPDGLQLTYEILYSKDNQDYTQLNGQLWLQQSSRSLKFQGTPPISMFNTDVYIKVIASDGYTLFMIYLQFKFVSFFLNAIFKRRNIYSTELCIVNSFFCKKITLLGDENEKAICLFNSLKRHMNIKQKKKKKTKRPTLKAKSILVYGLSINSNKGELEEEENKKQNAKNQENENIEEVQQEKSLKIVNCDELNQNFVGLSKNNSMQSNFRISNMNLNEFSNNIMNFAALSAAAKDDKSQLDMSSNLNKSKLQRAYQMSELRENQLLFINRLKQIKKPKNSLNPIINQFSRADGSIRFSKIIQYMIQEKITFSYNNEEYQAKSLIKDLKDQQSRLYKCVRAVIARYVLQFDERTELFFEFLKEEAYSRFNYTQKDWYKHYTQIICSSSIMNEKLQVICFPSVLIKKDVIKQTLVNLRLINQNEAMEKAISKDFINLSLVYELLIAEALGLLDYTPNAFSKSQGESIHLNFFQISSVEAFKAIKNPRCQGLRKMMNMTLANYGATQNMKLPNWIKFDQKSGCIILQGVPTSSDLEDITIRILDKQNFIIREFPLKVVDEEKEIQYEFDVDSIANTTRKSFSQDYITSTNLIYKNYFFSELGSPTQFQNSSNNQTKPSLFSNFNNPSLINNKSQKGPPSIFKKEPDIENNGNQQDSKEKQQCSPIYSQDECNDPSQQDPVNEKDNASSSFYTQKQIQGPSSKIEESLELDKNCPNESPKQKKGQTYLIENDFVETKQKQIGLNMKMETFGMIQKSKSIKTQQIIDSQDEKIIEEQSIIDQSNQKQTPNQFLHSQNNRECFYQQRFSDYIQQ
ncbi:hypothetical protein TTHERM_00627130 (macronuclear) [Tetrahymena thermophila SB210]|uniref:Calpain family cysteine protease n=1 Tax=Tetrahymena thermophila (strain SB210) TaxID=312017 RepID=Q23RY6_TETTS|nr:hypothetical protein TTHERM_00627130 [Tetrahymena thermophila SB210]EAR99253.2 hypothetical protein TTHERM_00627130 [Tetrahymena thermophila SB210]|eukprot:XP_001019498.2 hypothetical protein TTHERM_00627130 [Tetrahymena thermophila SB210]